MRKYFLVVFTAVILFLPLSQARAISIAEIQSQLQALALRIQALMQSQVQPSTKNLYLGMVNDSDVRSLQQYLISAGYLAGPATGNFTTQTLRAVKQFQISHGIVATGFVGPLTRAALRNVMASTLPVAPASRTVASSNLLSAAIAGGVSDNYGGGSGADAPTAPQSQTPVYSSDPQSDSGDSGNSSGDSSNPGGDSGSVSSPISDQSGSGSDASSTPPGSGSDSGGSTSTSTPPSDPGLPTPPPPSGNPNEPNGFTLITNRGFNSIATSSTDTTGAEGWDPNEESQWSHISIIQDPSAPVSPPNILAAFYPAGTVGGTTAATPARMLDPFPPAQSVYVSLWIKLSSNFRGNGTATNKAFYIWLDGQPIFFMSSEGVGDGTLVPMGRLQDDFDSRTQLPPNLVPDASITRAQWQHWEVVVKANTPGVANGEFSLWLDGVKVSEYSDITYLGSSQTQPFMMMDLEPIWGGEGDVVSADQYQYFDNVYVSTSGS